MTNDLTRHYNEHVAELVRRADLGDQFAGKTLAALSLLNYGWRPGDPDPADGPDDDGGGESVVDLSAYAARLAA